MFFQHHLWRILSESVAHIELKVKIAIRLERKPKRRRI